MYVTVTNSPIHSELKASICYTCHLSSIFLGLITTYTTGWYNSILDHPIKWWYILPSLTTDIFVNGSNHSEVSPRMYWYQWELYWDKSLLIKSCLMLSGPEGKRKERECCGLTWKVIRHHTVICSHPPFPWKEKILQMSEVINLNKILPKTNPISKYLYSAFYVVYVKSRKKYLQISFISITTNWICVFFYSTIYLMSYPLFMVFCIQISHM